LAAYALKSNHPIEGGNPMRKQILSALFGAMWLAGVMCGSPCRAESLIPEASADKVIHIVPPDAQEKLPVVSSVAIDPKGKFLAAVGDDHLVRIFDVSSGSLTHRIRSHADWVHVSAFRADGRILATSGADGRIRLWTPGVERSHDLLEQLPAIYALEYSPDGRYLAAAGFSDKVWVFDGEKGRLIRELTGPGFDLRAIAYSPDGARMAAAGRNGVVRIWETDGGRSLFDVSASPRRISALAYSPDGKLLAVAGQQRIVRLLDASTGKVVADMPPRAGEILSLCFCGPDALAAAGSGNEIHLWDITTRQERRRLVGHTGSVTALVLDRSSDTLISGGFDTTVRLWNLKAMEQGKITAVSSKKP
jgi:WD40 repeat protein